MNFADYRILRDLWRVCGRIGKVIDIFIYNKRSHLGKRFGFVWFSGVTNDAIIKQLCDIWFGYHKLFTSLPKLMKSENLKLESPMSHSRGVSSKAEKIISPDNSYASVVKGPPNGHGDCVNTHVDDILSFHPVIL